ncbi:hypothetical protein BTR23_23775 [Alkalihalophilus pseudofirmus]|nr:hypothetical protein BTR23_23775 [Alkalihalophilus pseudofirmus]
MRGEVVCHFSGRKPITIALGDVETRSLENPSTEQQVYGPKVGFIEDVHKNMAIMIKYFPDPRLKIKKYQVGSVTHTQIGVVYLEEYVDPSVLRKLQDRLKKVTTDQIISSKVLSQYLVDFSKSPFPLGVASDQQKTTVSLSRMNLRMKSNYEKTKPVTFHLDVKGDAEVIDVATIEELTDIKFIEKLERKMEQEIKKEIEQTIAKMKRINVEPWLLGHKIWATDPKFYETLNWRETGWVESKFNINVSFNISNTGQRGKYDKEKIGR